MKKLTLMLTGFSLAVGASVALAQQQPAAPAESSAVSSYSPPTQKHVKKAKKKTVKKGASAPAAAPAEGASQ